MNLLAKIKQQIEKLLTATGLTKKELSSRQFLPRFYSRYRSYVSPELTPEKLATIFKAADYGDVSRQANLFAEMEEKDAHLSSVLQTRKLAVTKNDWEVLPFSEDTKDIEIAQFIEEALSRIQFTADGHCYESLESGLLSLLDAIGKGYSALEIIWNTGPEITVKELIYVEPQAISFQKDWPRPRILTDKEPTYGEEIPEHKIILHRHASRNGFTPRVALLRPLAWIYLFKNYSIKDWLKFAETYGMPLRLGKIPNLDDKKVLDAMMSALEELGSSASGVIGTEMEVEFKEAEKRASVDIYKAFIEFCERAQSKAVLGQTLTTEIGDKGSYAASKTHGEVRQDIVKADSEQLSSTLRMQLIRPLVLFNFGQDLADRLPWFKFKYETPEDLNALATRFRTLVETGIPIGVNHARKIFNLPEPEADEPIITPPRTGPSFPGVPGFSPALGVCRGEDKKKRSLMYARPGLGTEIGRAHA